MGHLQVFVMRGFRKYHGGFHGQQGEGVFQVENALECLGYSGVAITKEPLEQGQVGRGDNGVAIAKQPFDIGTVISPSYTAKMLMFIDVFLGEFDGCRNAVVDLGMQEF